MKRLKRNPSRSGGVDLWMMVGTCAVAMLILFSASWVEAQTVTVLHSPTAAAAEPVWFIVSPMWAKVGSSHPSTALAHKNMMDSIR